MASKSAKYWACPDAVPVDRSLRPEDGWKLNIRWLIDEQRLGSRYGSVGYAVIPPSGGRHELHVHDNAEEVSIYLRGRGLRIAGDERFEIGPGDVGFVPAGVPHALINLSDTEPIELFCIYLGASSVQKTGYRHIGNVTIE